MVIAIDQITGDSGIDYGGGSENGEKQVVVIHAVDMKNGKTYRGWWDHGLKKEGARDDLQVLAWATGWMTVPFPEMENWRMEQV